jgi:hypothetical protein
MRVVSPGRILRGAANADCLVSIFDLATTLFPNRRKAHCRVPIGDAAFLSDLLAEPDYGFGGFCVAGLPCPGRPGNPRGPPNLKEVLD